MIDSNVSTDPAYFLLDGAFFQGPDYQVLAHYTNVLLENPSNTLVLTLLYESVDPDIWADDFKNLLQQLRTNNRTRKIFIIFDKWYDTFDWTDIISLVEDVYFVDFLMVRSWLFYCHYKLVPTNNSWSPTSQEFLFLLGKPNKFNRIKLLHKLAYANLTNRGVWSLNEMNSWHRDGIKMLLPELTDQELDEFLKTHTRTLDRVYRGHDYTKVMPNLEELNQLPKFNSFAFLAHDVQIYQDKLFAVIAETDFDRLYDHPRITEKTWAHIIQHLPFIIAGEPKSLEQLTEMGIDTFQDLLPIPNYDNPDGADYLQPTTIENQFKHLVWQKDFIDYYNSLKDPQWPSLTTIEQNFDQHKQVVNECLNAYKHPILSDIENRLNAVVTNIQAWLNDVTFTDEIKSRIDKNYARFNVLGEQNYNAYRMWALSHNIESCHLDILFYAHFSETPNYEISNWLNENAA